MKLRNKIIIFIWSLGKLKDLTVWGVNMIQGSEHLLGMFDVWGSTPCITDKSSRHVIFLG